MEFNWKVILGPEMQVKINDALDRLRVEGMAANIEVGGNILHADIKQKSSGRHVIEITIVPKGDITPPQPIDRCPKCGGPPWEDQPCDSCGYPD